MRGRPTKYSSDLIKKVDEYLAFCVDKDGEFHKTRGEKSDTYERILKVNLPKIEGFAMFIGVHKDTLTEWAKENDDFSVSLDKIRTVQHNRLVDEALAGNYNPVIAKLMLSSNHGYKEKSDMTTNGKELPTPIIPLNVLRDDSDTQDSSTTEED